MIAPRDHEFPHLHVYDSELLLAIAEARLTYVPAWAIIERKRKATRERERELSRRRTEWQRISTGELQVERRPDHPEYAHRPNDAARRYQPWRTSALAA